MAKNSIAIILPYFGKWPEWIDLFFYSCGQNKDIDFIFFTDCEVSNSNSLNLKFHSLSFEDYCQQVNDLLKINFRPANAYKLCDLRPFYGFIHRDILEGYDFWGFGDIDLVLGNVRSFYTDDLLKKFDVFSTHNDRLSGHLSLIRNNDKYIHLCFQITDWKNKLSNQENLALDEGDFSRIIFPESKIIGKFYRQIMMRFLDWKTAWEIYYSIFPLIHWTLRFRKRKLYFKEQHTTPILAEDGRLYKYESDSWFYKDGKVFNNRVNKDFMYLHFMIYKKNSFRNDCFWEGDFYKLDTEYDYSNGVVIDKNGFSKF
jgi:hypothetical protein